MAPLVIHKIYFILQWQCPLLLLSIPSVWETYYFSIIVVSIPFISNNVVNQSLPIATWSKHPVLWMLKMFKVSNIWLTFFPSCARCHIFGTWKSIKKSGFHKSQGTFWVIDVSHHARLTFFKHIFWRGVFIFLRSITHVLLSLKEYIKEGNLCHCWCKKGYCVLFIYLFILVPRSGLCSFSLSRSPAS